MVVVEKRIAELVVLVQDGQDVTLEIQAGLLPGLVVALLAHLLRDIER